MSLFDEPEWGASQTFSYYPEATQVSSSLLENSLQNYEKKRKKNDTQGSNKKRKINNNKIRDRNNVKIMKEGKTQKTTNNIPKKSQENKTQKDENNKKLKPGLSKQHGNESVPKVNKAKKKKADSLKEAKDEDVANQNADSSKLTGTAAVDVIEKVKKKKRKTLNKRNKYKELNMEQNKRKTKELSNGLAEADFKNEQNLDVQSEEISKACHKKMAMTKSNMSKIAISSSDTLNKELEAFSKKKKEIKKLKEINKEVQCKNKVTIASVPNQTQSSLISESLTMKGIEIHSGIGNKEKANKKCKKKKKEKQKTNVENSVKSGNISLNTEKKIKKGKAQKNIKNSVIKKKMDKFVQENSQIIKGTEDKGIVKKKKKKGNKKKKMKGKGDANVDEDLDFEEYDGGDADTNLISDIDSYMKELKFDQYKQGIDIMEELPSSDELEHASDKDWVTDEDTSDEDSDNNKVKVNNRKYGTSACSRVKIPKDSVKTDSKTTNERTHKKEKISIQKEAPKKSNKFNVKTLTKLLDEEKEVNKTPNSKAGTKPPLSPADALKMKMEEQLNAARFRLVNEQMYTSKSTDAMQIFQSDPDSFLSYHTGFQSQVSKWPINPLDLIGKWLKNKPKAWIVADFGCGEALLAEEVPQEKVHSFDLVALNPRVTVCDMAHTPLYSDSVDIVVFCLSLMGTNIKEFIIEANRVLHEGGIMKIAEVESRFTDVEFFVNHVKKFGFHCTYKDISMKYFYMFEFKKHRSLKSKTALPNIILKPCKYKKR